MAGSGPGVPSLEYQDYYDPRRPEDRDPGRDQEGLPEARPRAPPGQAPATSCRAAVQGHQRGQRGPVRPGQAQAYDQFGADWEAYGRGRRPGRPAPSDRAARSPGSAARRRSGSVRYEFRTTGDAGGFSRLLPHDVRRRTRAARRAPTGPGRGRRPTGGADLRGHPGRDGPRRRRPRPTDAARSASKPARASRPPSRPIAELTLEEAFHGTSRIVEIEGKRLEVTIPRGADTGSRIRLTGKAPGGRDLTSSSEGQAAPVFTRRGDDLEREVPVALGRRCSGARSRWGRSRAASC